MFSIEVNDLKESLTLGTYSNVTYFYDVYQNRVDGIVYNISDEVNTKSLLGSEGIAKSELFGSRVSRVLVRTADVGILDVEGEKEDVAEMLPIWRSHFLDIIFSSLSR